MIITDAACDAWRRWFDGDPRAGIVMALRRQTHVTHVGDGTQVVKTPSCKLVCDRAPGGMIRVIGVKRLRSDKGNVPAQRLSALARKWEAISEAFN